MLATPNQALLLWSTSWLSCYTSIQAYKKELHDLSFATGCVFITSLLYWSNPRKNWIRNLDMTISVMAISYHLWRSKCNNSYPFFVFTTCLLYPTSWYFYNQKKYWLSYYLHALMHISGNTSNLYLYNTIQNKEFVTISN